MGEHTDQSLVLDVAALSVSFGGTKVVHDVSFRLAPGECLALVGESGSGKSVTARSLIGLSGGDVTAERLRVRDQDVLSLNPRKLRALRGAEVGLVLQDALVSLDPLRPVGREIADALRLHTKLSAAQRAAKARELLAEAGVPEPEVRAAQRSGELSGGLRQRALIASAIALDPPVLIADEPTTALDATVQEQILDLLLDLKRRGKALLLISHDLAVVDRVADRVAVMNGGRIVEEGPTAELLRDPRHEYTRRLIQAVPSGRPRGTALSPTPVPSITALTPRENGPVGEAILTATGLGKSYGTRLVVDDVALTLHRGKTLGLVGESGSGKTTTARIVLGTTTPDAGEVRLHGQPWSGIPEKRRREDRWRIGAIYQDPLGSFDPRLTVGQILADAVSGGRSSRPGRFGEGISGLLEAVGLPGDVIGRRPLHLSGGQRQRVAIARALAPGPEIVVCDEPVSALDVSVQAQVLDLLDELQRTLGLTYLFISHDLGVVQHVSDDVAVMKDGRIVESGPAAQLFADPRHPYTQRLLTAAPKLPASTP